MKTTTTNNTPTTTKDVLITIAFFAVPLVIAISIIFCSNVYGISDMSTGS